MTNMHVKEIIPTDVKVYYENGIPYLEYRGIPQNGSFDKVEVYIPKINLNISSIEYTSNLYAPNELNVTFSANHIIEPNNYNVVVTVIERNMTKAQIEKELGYKVNIVEK